MSEFERLSDEIERLREAIFVDLQVAAAVETSESKRAASRRRSDINIFKIEGLLLQLDALKPSGAGPKIK